MSPEIAAAMWDLPAPEPSERRTSPRGRALLAGKMIYGDGFTADCTIRDLTETGARIRLPPDLAPKDFHLIVLRDGKAHRARIAWTRYPHAGVAFEATHDLNDEGAPKGLRTLWGALSPRSF